MGQRTVSGQLNDRPRIGYSHVQAALASGSIVAVGPTGVVI